MLLNLNLYFIDFDDHIESSRRSAIYIVLFMTITSKCLLKMCFLLFLNDNAFYIVYE